MEKIKTLNWHRLLVTFKNIRLINSSKASPFEAIQAIVKGVTIAVEGSYDPESSPVFFHIKGKGHSFKLYKFADIPVEIIFCRKDTAYVMKWQDVLKSYISDPSYGKNFDIVSLGEIEERSFDKLVGEHGDLKGEGGICLEFLMPLPFKAIDNKKRTHLAKASFINLLKNRFSALFDVVLSYKSNDDEFSILPYYWKYTEIRHPSISQPGSLQYINGCVGKLYIKQYWDSTQYCQKICH